MFPCHRNFVLQLYLYRQILVCISAQFMKNGLWYGKHDNTFLFLGLLASLVCCNKFGGDQFTLCNIFSCFFLTFDLWEYALFSHCSSLSVVSIVLDTSTVLSKDKQISHFSVLNQFTTAVKNTYSENCTEFIFIFCIS